MPPRGPTTAASSLRVTCARRGSLCQFAVVCGIGAASDRPSARASVSTMDGFALRRGQSWKGGSLGLALMLLHTVRFVRPSQPPGEPMIRQSGWVPSAAIRASAIFCRSEVSRGQHCIDVYQLFTLCGSLPGATVSLSRIPANDSLCRQLSSALLFSISRAAS